jgi:AraC-like DNA-binding protein
LKNTESTYPKVYLYRRIVQAKLYIDTHYSGYMDLSNISGEACFSKFHFIRLFRKIYGRTPHQYLTFVRIRKAKQLLQNGATVSETCHAVGFDSISSFSGLFRRTVGLSPSAYLLQQQQRRTQVSHAPLLFVPGCFAEKQGWTKKSNFQEA